VSDQNSLSSIGHLPWAEWSVIVTNAHPFGPTPLEPLTPWFYCNYDFETADSLTYSLTLAGQNTQTYIGFNLVAADMTVPSIWASTAGQQTQGSTLISRRAGDAWSLFWIQGTLNNWAPPTPVRTKTNDQIYIYNGIGGDVTLTYTGVAQPLPKTVNYLAGTNDFVLPYTNTRPINTAIPPIPGIQQFDLIRYRFGAGDATVFRFAQWYTLNPATGEGIWDGQGMANLDPRYGYQLKLTNAATVTFT